MYCGPSVRGGWRVPWRALAAAGGGAVGGEERRVEDDAGEGRGVKRHRTEWRSRYILGRGQRGSMDPPKLVFNMDFFARSYSWPCMEWTNKPNRRRVWLVAKESSCRWKRPQLLRCHGQLFQKLLSLLTIQKQLNPAHTHMFSSSLRQLALEWFQFEPPGPQCDDMESPQPAGATDEQCI